MKKLIYSLFIALMFLNISCEDYLDVDSPSSADADLVFSTTDEAYKVVVGCYDIWRGCNVGLFYDLQVVGSDSECHPEAYDAQTRHIPEGLYAAEISIDYSNGVSTYANLYKVINRANIIMENIALKSDYQQAVDAGTTNEWTQLYGEASVFRAEAYLELIRNFGDVPYFTEALYSAEAAEGASLTSRDAIFDGEIASLQETEKLMYRLGEGGITAERFSRTYADALIGKMALHAGGYSLRRTDFDYGISLDKMGSEMWDATYARPAEYTKYYQIAKTYLNYAIYDNAGSAYLITYDERGEGFDNPFQRNFQYNMDLVVSPESLFEVGTTRGKGNGNSEHPYAFGRPSGGGNSNAYPCKDYGQSRMYASFYYGDYDPDDMRRDVSICVTANSGACSEKLMDFTPGSRNKGGLANNKWDESRMADPYTAYKRSSGINWVRMRMSDVILMLSETYAELGEEALAKEELTKVRSRAFAPADQTTKVTNYIAALSGEELKEAIQQERKLELAGEGVRRFDLIRTGKLPEKIKEVRDAQKAMVAGLTSNGYYTFANGNQISNYIYVKAVNVADYGMDAMLTTQCTVDESDETYPLRFPSWRGNCDLWEYTDSDGNLQMSETEGERSLAIQGLFRYIDPEGAEAAALEADGYVKTDWGSNILTYEDQYTTDVFKGYTDSYYSSGVPPRYLLPLGSETIIQSNGNITNGYGFAQQ